MTWRWWRRDLERAQELKLWLLLSPGKSQGQGNAHWNSPRSPLCSVVTTYLRFFPNSMHISSKTSWCSVTLADTGKRIPGKVVPVGADLVVIVFIKFPLSLLITSLVLSKSILHPCLPKGPNLANWDYFPFIVLEQQKQLFTRQQQSKRHSSIPDELLLNLIVQFQPKVL